MIQAITRLIIRSVSTSLGTLQVKFFLIGKQRIPKNLKVDGFIFWKVQKTAKVIIGNHFTLNSRKASNLVGINNRASFQAIGNGVIRIGDYCGFTSTVFSSRSSITVGNNVKIGANVRIFDHDYHSLSYENRRNAASDSGDVKSEAVIIEDDVFIGTNAMILKGVRIGARSVIGAGSVVTIREIPPDSIVAGNPAVVLKTRPLS